MHPLNRRLTEDELNQSADLFRYNTPTGDVKQYVEDKFGKHITSDDVRNVRRRMRSSVSGKPIFHLILAASYVATVS